MALRFKDGEQGGGVWANRFPTKRDYYLYPYVRLVLMLAEKPESR